MSRGPISALNKDELVLLVEQLQKDKQEKDKELFNKDKELLNKDKELFQLKAEYEVLKEIDKDATDLGLKRVVVNVLPGASAATNGQLCHELPH